MRQKPEVSDVTVLARVKRFYCKKWLVFITACLSMTIDVGFIFSSGALFVDLMDTFQVNRSQAALVQSVMMAVRFGSGVLSGAIVQKFGTLRAGLFGSCIATVGLTVSFFATSVYYLVFSMGILLALGSSCLFIASSTAVGQHFTGKTGLILMSIQSAGGGLGGMLYPFVLEYLSSSYGLKGSLMLTGGFYMQLIPASLLWTDKRRKHTPSEEKRVGNRKDDLRKDAGDDEEITEEWDNSKGTCDTETDKYITENDKECSVLLERRITSIDGKDVSLKTNGRMTVLPRQHRKETVWESLKELALSPSFALFAVGMGIAYPALGILFIFIVDLFMDAGLTIEKASLGMLLVHLFSILGRLLPGVVMQSKRVSTLSVPIVASVVTSISMAGLAYANILEVCLFLCCLIGVPYGMFVSVFSVTSLKLAGISRLSNAIGVLFTLNGLGTAIAGPTSGLLRDSLGSYQIPFLAAASTILFGCLLFCISFYIRRLRKRYITETMSLLNNKTTDAKDMSTKIRCGPQKQ